MAGVAGLIKAWVHGWALSRGVDVPAAEPDGYRLDVGRPGHRVRYVLSDSSAAGHRARALTEPGTWLKVSGSREEVAETVPSNWNLGPPEYLMSMPLTVRPAIPAPSRTGRNWSATAWSPTSSCARRTGRARPPDGSRSPAERRSWTRW